MPLISKLFRGDPKFESCLIQDTAHITIGAMGSHVSKIHTALFILDNFSVAPAELSSGKYGTSTAAGVLAYKRKRNIINKSYQTQPDNIVGKMTIASMDSEIFKKEQLGNTVPDPRTIAWTTQRDIVTF